MQTKIIVHDYHSYKDESFLFIKYFHPRLNKFEYIFTLIFERQKEDIIKKGNTWWNIPVVIRLFDLFERKYSYEEITVMLNKEFNLNLDGHSSPKGYKGKVVKKIENVRRRKLNWEQYTDVEKLIADAIKIFDETLNEKANFFQNE
jgi:hypothetical protein